MNISTTCNALRRSRNVLAACSRTFIDGVDEGGGLLLSSLLFDFSIDLITWSTFVDVPVATAAPVVVVV